MDAQKSEIITFYSYKGGVGRSMALANVAWLLAEKYHQKVLMVDWDLEAPGLHRFFNIREKKIENGLIDLFYDYKDLLRKEIPSLDEDFIDMDKYIMRLSDYSTGGSISILPAGKMDGKYASRVTDFNWIEFYKNWHGFGLIEHLKGQLKKKADFILIDSRTGVTDIGGICTLQMPDLVVLLFSLNEQNISGTEMIIETILKKSTEVTEQITPPKLILVPSRVERYLEKEIKQEWEIKAAKRLGEYLPEKENSIIYMKKKSIPYVGYYSFGEMLAVKEDPYEELAESLDGLTTMVLEASGLLVKETLPTPPALYKNILNINIIKQIIILTVTISLSILIVFTILSLEGFLKNFTNIFVAVTFIMIVYYFIIKYKKRY